jgi:hypothetical protein
VPAIVTCAATFAIIDLVARLAARLLPHRTRVTEIAKGNPA